MEKLVASIITIGDELLIGQVVDTNSAWMAQELNKNGIWVGHRVAVGDVWDDIWQALDQESHRAPIILITGGLVFFPSVALGPVVEHLAMNAGTLY